MPTSGGGCYGSIPSEPDGDGSLDDGRRDAGPGDDAGHPSDAADAEVIPGGSVFFVLRRSPDAASSVWATSALNLYDIGLWISVFRGREELHIEPGICDWPGCMCDECISCPRDCGVPVWCDATEVAPGGSVTLLWDGVEHAIATCGAAAQDCWQPGRATDGSYDARFCWWPSHEDTSACESPVVRCADVPFTLPDADGIVEYEVEGEP
ncbi:MAG: hypothetical protein HY905_00705 [Deltaproteobacteria bacterium]|nr:hypothetical protein [Deltaproteobacteria bacterium]